MKKYFVFQMILTAALLCGGCVLFGAAPSQYTGKVSVNSVLATVDGEPVTLLDVVHESAPYERELAGIYAGDRLVSETTKVRRRILDDLILRKLVLKEYKKEPFDIPNQTLEAALDRRAKGMGNLSREDLEKKVKASGMTMDEFRKKVREQIIVDVLLIRNCDRQTVVTPKEVYDEYLANPDQFRTPEQVDFQIIQINKENARSGTDAKSTSEKLLSSIKNADEVLFGKFAEEYSDDPLKMHRSSGMELPKLRPEFQAALKGHKAGDVVGPVETPEAFFFLRITAMHEAKKIPFNKVSKELYDKVMDREIRKKRAEYEKKLRDQALIKMFI